MILIGWNYLSNDTVHIGEEVRMTKNENYHVALSFAGEQRVYVDEVANHLKQMGVSVFYDRFVASEMWGKDLNEFFHHVYEYNCDICVIFVSKEYAEKHYPTQEKRFALSDSVKVIKGRILQVKFDKTKLPGIPSSIHYLNSSDYTPQELANEIAKKI